MTRKECLEQAMGCVLRDRNNVYGGPEDSFGVIANFWSAYLGRKVYPHDVAMMMSLLKIARAKSNPAHADSFVDLAGYAACGAECAGIAAEEAAEFEADHKFLESVFGKYKTEADAEPEFKPGDRVEALSFDGKRWEEGVVRRTEVLSGRRYYTVDLPNGEGHCLSAESIRRPATRAEGCEALVEKDAPQTPAELYDRIIASNPATYGRPRKPTGEELAEMAEEETHG